MQTQYGFFAEFILQARFWIAPPAALDIGAGAGSDTAVVVDF